MNINDLNSRDRAFGKFKIQFFKGKKDDNDYVIRINTNQITDEYIFNVLHKFTEDKYSALKLLKLIWELGQISSIEKENEVYEIISNLEENDELKAILYAIWHRLIIDDRCYPTDKGLNGRKRLLGQIYSLFAKKFGLEMPNYILSLPEEIYKLGFPKGLEEVIIITTEQWAEIYEIYKNFYKKISDTQSKKG